MLVVVTIMINAFIQMSEKLLDEPLQLNKP